MLGVQIPQGEIKYICARVSESYRTRPCDDTSFSYSTRFLIWLDRPLHYARWSSSRQRETKQNTSIFCFNMFTGLIILIFIYFYYPHIWQISYKFPVPEITPVSVHGSRESLTTPKPSTTKRPNKNETVINIWFIKFLRGQCVRRAQFLSRKHWIVSICQLIE